MSEDKTRLLTADEAARLVVPEEPGGDKTRMLTAEELERLMAGTAATAPRRERTAAEPGRQAPRVVRDKIVFFCSNGHRIVVDSRLAGKRGTCSKRGCGVPVVIPIPGQTAAGPAVAPPPAESPAAPPEGGSREGPGELAFELEADAEPEAVPADEATEPAAEAAAEPTVSWPFVTDESQPGGVPLDNLGIGGAPAADAWGGFDAEEIDHPTARLVARLWQERAHGGVVEVHLSGGSVILPEWYDPRWSCGTHALFAAEAPDTKTLTLTAVAWDQVQKVVVRHVRGTPEGMFGG